MMARKVQLLLGWALLLGSSVTNTSLAAQGLTDFQRQRQEIFLEQQKLFQERQKQIESNAQSLSENKAIQPSETPNTGVVPECDCDNANDPANTPNNFLYGAHQKKTYRIKPYCRCRQTEVEGFVGIVPVSGAETKATQPTWDIHY